MCPVNSHDVVLDTILNSSSSSKEVLLETFYEEEPGDIMAGREMNPEEVKMKTGFSLTSSGCIRLVESLVPGSLLTEY